MAYDTYKKNRFRIDVDHRNVDEDLIDVPVPVKLGSQVGINQIDMTRVFDVLDNGGNDEYTKLLLQAPGRNGDHVYFDESRSKHSITTVGNPSTVRHPLDNGKGIVYFDGSGDYLLINNCEDFNFGSNDFTIEFWLFPTIASNQVLMTKRQTNGSYGLLFAIWADLTIRVNASSSLSSWDIAVNISLGNIILNKWNHIAFVRNGNTWSGYINGKYGGGFTSSLILGNPSSPWTVGADGGGTGTAFSGSMSEIHFSKGVARYNSDFTPQSYQFTSDKNTVLLIHVDECNNSAIIRDLSDNPKPIQSVGNTKVVHNTGNFSERPVTDCNGAIYFDGTTDYITTPTSSDINFGSENWTVELFVYFSRAIGSHEDLIISYNGTAKFGWFIRRDNQGKLVILLSNDGNTWNFVSTSSEILNSNSWMHISVVRNGNTILAFKNGIQLSISTSSFSGSISSSSDLIKIGAEAFGSDYNAFQGYMTEVRVSKGIARYTSNFIPSPIKFTHDAYSKLHIHSDFNSSNFIQDATLQPKTLTKYGDVKLVYLPEYNGETSIYFDGNDYLTATYTNDWNFGVEDFTIESWILPNSNSNGPIISGGNGVIWAESTFWLSYDGPTSKIWWMIGGTSGYSVNFYSNLTLNKNQWNHIALVRNNGSFLLFINGVLDVVYSSYSGNVPFNSSTKPLHIGIDGSATGSNFIYYNGYLTGLRITKGLARYTTNFIPPTSQYLTDSYTKLLIHPNDTIQDLSVDPPSFPQKAIYFDGSGDSLQVSNSSNWLFGSDDFTIDTWINPTTVSGYQRLVCHLGTSNNDRTIYFALNGNRLLFACSTSSASSFDYQLVATSTIILPNSWNHIAIVRSGNELQLYVNGIKDSTVGTISGSIRNATTLYIGAGDSSGENYAGSMSELRISIGTARWTESFTPPTSPYLVDSYTKLLIHPNDFNITDETGKYVTINGNCNVNNASQLSHSISKYGDVRIANIKYPLGFYYFDGSGDYLNIPDSSDWDFGNGDFTLDAWIYPHSTGGYQRIISAGNTSAGSNNLWSFGYGSGWHGYVELNWAVFNGSGYWDWYSGNIPALVSNSWQHVALVRNGNNIYFFHNGILYNTVGYSTLTNGGTDGVVVGARSYSGIQEFMNGYMYAARITKEFARWTSSFIPSRNTPEVDSSTKLLISVKNAQLIDETGKSIYTYGDTKCYYNANDSIEKCLYFDGSNDYLVCSGNESDFAFGKDDFTIEFWINPSTWDATRSIIGNRTNPNPGDTVWSVEIYSAVNSIEFHTGYTEILNPGKSIPSGYWTHIAIVRRGSTLLEFYNGILVASVAISYNFSTVSPLYIGKDIHPANGGLLDFNGKLANIRISRSIARYTSNFVPPTTPFEADKYTVLLIQPKDEIQDLSWTNHSISKYGDVKSLYHSVSFIDRAMYFDGTGDYLILPSSTDWNFGSGDFTIDFWCNPSKFDNIYENYLAIGPETNAYFKFSRSRNGYWNGQYYVGFSGVEYQLGYIPSTVQVWIHIALVRNGNQFLFFVDGQLKSISQLINTTTILSGNLYIGTTAGLIENFNGYLAEFRITKGLARWTTDFNPSSLPYGSYPNRKKIALTTSDPIDSYTKLLLGPSNGTIKDVSPTSTGIINNILPRYIYFDGSGDYLTVPDSPDWNFGSGEFTIDCWVNVINFTGNIRPILHTNDPSATSYIGFYADYSTGVMFTYEGWGASGIKSPSRLSDGWYHIAITRKSDLITMFIDGKIVATKSGFNKTAFSNVGFVIGEELWGHYLYGYLAKLRISKGIVRWTSNFDHTNIDYTIDSYTKLFINPSSSTIIDETGKSVTVVGNTVVNNFSSPTIHSWPQKAIHFDGNADYLSIPNSEDFNFGSGDFTIEFWIFQNGNAGGSQSAAYMLSKTDGHCDWCTGYQIQFTDSGYITLIATSNGSSWDHNYGFGSITSSMWNHVAIVRQGTQFSCYINGIRMTNVYTSSLAIQSNSYALGIGGQWAGVSQNYTWLNGYLSNVRISKGIARYTVNFTPSTSDFVSDSYTKLLIQPDVVNSKLFKDLSSINHTISVSGGCKSIEITKFDESVMYFDGVDDHIVLPPNDNLLFAKYDFTIDFWIRLTTSIYDNKYVVSTWPTSRIYYPFGIRIYNNCVSVLIGNNADNSYSVLINGTIPINDLKWHHIAFVRYGNTYRLFVDGKIESTVKDVSDVYTQLFEWWIGGPGRLFDNRCMNGWLSNFRITKGIARWTAIFNPPKFPINNSELPIELTTWTGRESIFWTKLPAVRADKDVIITLYADKSQPNNYQYVGEIASEAGQQVWTNNYVGVYQYAQDPSGISPQLLDSSPFRNHGSTSGSMTYNDLILSPIGFGIDFDGIDDVIIVPHSTSLSISKKVTIEAFVKRKTPFSVDVIVLKGGDWTLSPNYALSLHSSSTIQMYCYYQGGWRGGNFCLDDSWKYVAGTLDEDLNEITLYRDHNLMRSIYSANSTPVTLNENNTESLTMGSQLGSATYYGKPILSLVKISSGIIRTPPYMKVSEEALNDNLLYYPEKKLYLSRYSGLQIGDSTLPDIQTGDADVHTRFLLSCDAEAESHLFKDASIYNHSVIKNDNTKIVRHPIKDETNCIYFDGNGDYLSVPYSSDWNFGSGNFTIEFWYYPLKSTGQDVLEQWQQETFGNLGWAVYVNNNNNYLGFTLSPTGANGSYFGTESTTYLTVGIWQHLAVVRNGNVITLYKNGIVIVSSVFTGSIYNSTLPITIGDRTNSYGLYAYGMMSNIRISKGIARYTGTFTPPISHFQSDEYTKLLIHGNELTDTSFFPDKSPSKKTITTYGNTKHIKFVPFPNVGVAYFDGTSDYLSVPDNPDWDFNANDFTIECWFNLFNASGAPAIISKGEPYSSFAVLLDSSLELLFAGSSTGSNWEINTGYLPSPIVLGKWYHFSIVRNGSNWKMFLDGKLFHTFTNTFILYKSSYPLTIGYYHGAASDYRYFNGLMFDVRVSKGIARYTTEFIPPTQPFSKQRSFDNVLIPDASKGIPVVSQAGGGIDQYTKLMLHFDGTDGQTTFPDSSDFTKSITRYGDTKIVKHPFEGESNCIYLDGSGDYLVIPDSEDFHLGSNDFTFEFWINTTASGINPNKGILSQYRNTSAGNSSWLIYLSNGELISFVCSPSGGFSGATGLNTISSVSDGKWHHVAFVRSGTSLKSFLDGVLKNEITLSAEFSVYNSTHNVLVGTFYTESGSIGSYNLPGYLIGIRISKGIARYSSTFTPSRTRPVLDGYDVLYIPGNDEPNTTTFTDSTGRHSISPYGNSKHFRYCALSKFENTGIVYFDGNGDYLSIPHHEDLILSNVNFTIDFWVYPIPNGSLMRLFGKNAYGNTNMEYDCHILSSNQIQFRLGDGNVVVYSILSPVILTSVWTHVAIVRFNGYLYLYLNGILTNSVYIGNFIVYSSSNPLEIGRMNYTNTYYFNGYLSEFRFSKGFARWTSNFPVPNNPYTKITTTPVQLVNFKDRFDAVLDLDINQMYLIIPTSAGDRGLFAGGAESVAAGAVNNIEYVDISISSNSLDFGDLTVARRSIGGCSNGINDRGLVIAGAYPSTITNIIDYISISVLGNAVDFGDTTYQRDNSTSSSNGTNNRALSCGGYNLNTTYYNNIDYVTISVLGNSVDFGDISSTRSTDSTSNGSNNRMLIAGGWVTSSPNAINIIEYITISALGNSSDFGDLTSNKRGMGSTSNGIGDRGIFAGSRNEAGSDLNVIEYATISTLGNSLDFGDLTQNRCYPGATSSGTNNLAIFGGGLSGTSYQNTIDRITITSLGNANDFGDLSYRKYCISAISNA